MSDRLKRPIALAIGLAMLVALSATPVMGQSGDDVQVAAASGNASKVDGKSAVGANASVAARAGKLVSTNNQGLLPSNILNPLWSLLQGIPAAFADGQITWAEITGKPAGFADDVDNGAFVSTLTGDIPVAASSFAQATFSNVSRNVDVSFQIVPSTVNVPGFMFMYYNPLIQRNADGTLNYLIYVYNSSAAAQTFKLRVTMRSEGIALAGLKKAFNAATFKIAKKKDVPRPASLR